MKRPLLGTLVLAIGLVAALVSLHAAQPGPPNIVVIYCDDLGYGDLGSYGHPSIRTPHLDRMATEGLRFTDFYSGAEVCTPSRAALLTGRYALRSGMSGGSRRVLFPDSQGGLPPGEITIAEALRDHGYATAHIGKWHLGIHEGSRPQDQGFAYTYGIPYSNDMDGRPDLARGSVMSPTPPAGGWNVPLLRNGEIIERPVDQTTITRRYTEESLRFIRESHAQNKPFFLYLAHTMPHVPLFASEDFAGKSPRGIYGDTVEEIDGSTGQILAALREAGLAANTLVVFTSDNGPWLTQGLQGGSAGLLRDGKGSTWEGGMRVPAIAWLPGRIKPGVIRQPASVLDLFPTALALAGAPRPPGVLLDGRDLRPLLFEQAVLPEYPFIYYRGTEIFACRLGKWKAHFKTRAGYGGPAAATHETPLLFNLALDPSESVNVAADHPEVLAAIATAIAAHEATVAPVPLQL